MCCDKLLFSKSKIIFYTCIYKIQSKFDFAKYEEWGNNLVKFLTNYKLVVFTNKETYNLVKKFKNSNIEFIIKELEDFELYEYKKILKKNTKNKYFPNLNISYLLILIWLNRHLFLKEIAEKYKSDYYCHIDWGYIREENCKNIVIETEKLEENKIHFGLIKNKRNYIKNLYNQIKDWDKEKVEKTLSENLYSIGGGCMIINKKLISDWISMYRKTLFKFIQKKIDFKDDQTIIRTLIFDKHNYQNFNLITYKQENWFPFKDFLISENEEERLEFDFKSLFQC